MFLINDMPILAMVNWLLPPALILLIYLVIWIFREPFNGTLLICLCIPIMIPIPSDIIDSSFWTIRLHHLFTVITFCALLTAILRHKYQRFASTVLVVPFGLYLIANVLSLYNTSYLENSIRQFIKLLFVNVSMYMVITTTINSRDRLKKIIKVLLGTGLAISLVGMIQVIAYRFLGMNLFLNISNSSKVAAVAFEESVWFPQYITFLLSITLPLYFSNSFIKWKPQMTVCMCVFGIVIVSGLNRSSYVVTIAIVIVATILKIGGKRLHSLAKATVFLMMALLLASLIPSFFEKEWKLVRIRSQGEMFSFEEPANARRVDLATETLKHIKEHPFIGKGFGSWGQVVPPQTIEGGGSTGGSAFNVILGVLYDGGIIGLIALGLICYLYLKRCLDLLKITRNPYHKTIIYIAILVFTDIIITAQFHPVWLMGYAWLAIAMGMSITNLIEGELVNENRLSTAQLKSRWW